VKNTWTKLTLMSSGFIFLIVSGCGGSNNGGNVCDGITCSNHGDCVEVDGAASCRCDSGYVADGLHCVSEDPCAGQDCSGHGTCVNNSGTAECNCDQDYHAVGLTCVLGADPCDGITCSGHGACQDQAGTAFCDCDSGYHAVSGPDCVADDPCDGVGCSGHGTCDGATGSPVCTCDAGYHVDGEGTHCLPDVDPCIGETCSGHGSCVTNVDGFAECQCDAGFHPVGLTCVADGDWPPSIDSLYEVGVGCVLPACDPMGDPGYDPAGNWERTLTTTASDCSAMIGAIDARAKVGNVAVESPIALTTFSGTCDYNDEQEHVGTVKNGIIASCDSNLQTLDIISIETGIVTWSGTEGIGTARVYLVDVPIYVGGDCLMEMDVVYEKLP